MYHPDTELLFPSRVIAVLEDLRSESWRGLVASVKEQPVGSLENLAFVHMMVKLNGCLTCNADSFRAMRGCTDCAQQAVRRFKGSDQDLLDSYAQALKEIGQPESSSSSS